MECSNCHAKIERGCVYCENCGHEVMVVPDYNILEDDFLVSILDETPNTKSSENDKKEQLNNEKRSFKDRLRNDHSFRMSMIWVAVGLIVALVIVISIYLNSYSYQMNCGKRQDKLQTKAAYAQALAHYNKAIKVKETAEAYTAIGYDEFRLEQFSAAESAFANAIEQDQTYVNAYVGLTHLYLWQKDYISYGIVIDSIKSEELLKKINAYLPQAPEFSVAEGHYEDDLEIEISGDGFIFYTTDGSNPTPDSEIYTEPIKITDGSTVIKAINMNKKGVSAIKKGTYVISYTSPEYPQLEPSGGTYYAETWITITPNGDDETIYYTWDGTVPTASSAKYTGPIKVPEGNNILSILVVDRHGMTSDILRTNYKYMP